MQKRVQATTKGKTTNWMTGLGPAYWAYLCTCLERYSSAHFDTIR